jgi:hypothetical protein
MGQDGTLQAGEMTWISAEQNLPDILDYTVQYRSKKRTRVELRT